MAGLGDILNKPDGKLDVPSSPSVKRDIMAELKEELKDAVSVATLRDLLDRTRTNQPSQQTSQPHESPIKFSANLNLNEMIEGEKAARKAAEDAKNQATKQWFESQAEFMKDKISQLQTKIENPPAAQSPGEAFKEFVVILQQIESFKKGLVEDIKAQMPGTATGTLLGATGSNIDTKVLIELEKLRMDSQFKLEEMRQAHEKFVEESRSNREMVALETKQKWDLEIMRFDLDRTKVAAEQQRWDKEFREKAQQRQQAGDSLRELGAAFAEAIGRDMDNEKSSVGSSPVIAEQVRKKAVQDSVPFEPTQVMPDTAEAEEEIAGQEEDTAPSPKYQMSGFRCPLDMGDKKCNTWIAVPKGAKTARCSLCDSVYEIEQ